MAAPWDTRARSRSSMATACSFGISVWLAQPTISSARLRTRRPERRACETPRRTRPSSSWRIADSSGSCKLITVDLTMDHHSPVFQAGPDAPHVTPPAHPEDPPRTSVRRTLAHAWAMIRPYWASEDRWAAWGLLLAVVLLTLGMVYINVLFNRWNSAFFNALQEKNQTAFFSQLTRVSWLIAVFIILAVYQLYLNQMLEIRWRRWLTDRYLRTWLADGAYYRMQLVARETDNPDQRIAEDLHLLASHTLGLFVGGLRAGVTLATFVAILWGLSGTLTVPVGGISITLPGYMVWVAVLYAI